MSEDLKKELNEEELDGVTGGVDSATRKFGKKVGDKVAGGSAALAMSDEKLKDAASALAMGKTGEKTGVVLHG